jgi:hypothetical protein
MKTFRKSRDTDGRFALTTLRTSQFDVDTCLQQMQTIRSRAEAQVEAEIAIKVAAEDATEAAEEDLTKCVSELISENIALTPNELSLPEPPHAPEKIDVALVLAPTPPAPAQSVDVAKTAAPAAAATRKRAKPRIKKAIRRTLACHLPKPELTTLERHQRKCAICKHREREQLEEDFLNWSAPDQIADDYDLEDYRCIYRHAHATGLMELRSMNLRFAAESIVEQSASVTPSADAVLRAIRMCTRINNRGEWHEPPSHVIFSSTGRASAAPQHQPALPAPESPENPTHSPVSNRQLPARLESDPK